MNNFFSGLKESFRTEIQRKEIYLWFGIGFVIILAVLFAAADYKFSWAILIEAVAMAVILVIMYISTRAYMTFLDNYYESGKKKLGKRK